MNQEPNWKFSSVVSTDAGEAESRENPKAFDKIEIRIKAGMGVIHFFNGERKIHEQPLRQSVRFHDEEETIISLEGFRAVGD